MSEQLINFQLTAANNGLIPETFKFGFAATTGFFTNIHELQNIKIQSIDPVIALTVPSAASLTDIASSISNTEDPVINNNDSTLTTTISPGTDLEVSKTVNNITPGPGEAIAYTITVTNTRPSNDWINGNQGKDTIYGGKGNDFINGGKDDDCISGDDDNYIIFGELNNDTISGGKWQRISHRFGWGTRPNFLQPR